MSMGENLRSREKERRKKDTMNRGIQTGMQACSYKTKEARKLFLPVSLSDDIGMES